MNMMSSQEQYQPVVQPQSIQNMQGYGNPLMTDTIASMRWEVDPLVSQLYRMLGGYQITVDEQNNVIRKREKGTKPLMNDVGIERVISLVRGVVNPVTSLSNIDDEEANELIRQVLYRFVIDLCINNVAWEVSSGDRGTVMNIVKSIVFMQCKRPVGGHESRNFRTQSVEQNIQQGYNQQQQQNGGMFSFMRRKG